jgi:hypothetical protein
MNAWLLQIVVNLVLAIGITVLWIRLRRPPQDDPRLSRGLQLLQSKIAVLEDLSDRTDAQVKQLNQLIEQKARLLQNKIIESEHQISRVDSAMQKSKEVAEIFQDKIPHEEIIERQQTVKYVRAAQMAHAGHSLDDIAAEVDLPAGQLELIAKLNKDQLVFDADALPEWAKSEIKAGQTDITGAGANAGGPLANPMDTLFTPPQEEYSSLKRLGEEFRNACVEFDKNQILPPHPLETLAEAAKPVLSSAAATLGGEAAALLQGARNMSSRLMNSAKDMIETVPTKPGALSRPAAANGAATGTPAKAEPEVRKVEFPRVDINKNLL